MSIHDFMAIDAKFLDSLSGGVSQGVRDGMRESRQQNELVGLGAPGEAEAACGVGDWVGEQTTKQRVGLGLVGVGAVVAGAMGGAMVAGEKKQKKGAAIGAGAGAAIALATALGLFLSWRDKKPACTPSEPSEPESP